jgi:hypothetical protein
MATLGGNPKLSEYEEELSFPQGFAARTRPLASERVSAVMELRQQNKRHTLVWLSKSFHRMALSHFKEFLMFIRHMKKLLPEGSSTL